jgi:hypothetical protein
MAQLLVDVLAADPTNALYQGTTLVGPYKPLMTRALAVAALFLSQLGFAQHSLAPPPGEDIIFAVFNKALNLYTGTFSRV